ncbi:MAG: hypothetical protein J6L98_00490 [Bacteroidales bacterium]|nr:hypothetical protein [Bacteroidales bacterium]
MNIENIEKCQMLLDKLARLQKAANIISDLQRLACVTISGLAKDAIKVELVDEELNLAIQDAIDARIRAIESRIETL